MKCSVCGKEHKGLLCPQCGFDASTDYGSYPTLAPVKHVPSVPALRREWEQNHPEPVEEPTVSPTPEPEPAKPPRKQKLWQRILVLLSYLGLGGGMLITIVGGFRDYFIPSYANVLGADEIPYSFTGSYAEYSVLDSEYQRQQIRSVTFLDTLADMPDDAWDVSEMHNGKVMAWVEPNGSLYDLYIGGEDGVWADTSCGELFAGYRNAEYFAFGDAFHTEHAQDMGWMFHDCRSLTTLELSGFDTANVQYMDNMFDNCNSLTSLDLSSFDTANVQDMDNMFYGCESLTSLDLSSFDTANVQDMDNMFYNCMSLSDLTLGDRFVTTNATTYDMFAFCPGGKDYQHLLN